MAKNSFYHTIMGKRYKIIFEYPSKMGDADGICNAPHDKDKCIKISTGLEEKRELEVICHEHTHACHFQYASEEFVEASSKSLSDLLWSLGWRKIK